MFCEYCGKELPDEAYICTGCGRLVKELNVKKKREKKESKEGVSTLTKIFMIITITLLGVAIICLASFFANFDLRVMEERIQYGSGYYTTSINLVEDVYLYRNWSAYDAAIVFASIALAFAITQFIMALIQDKKFSGWKMTSIIIFILSVSTFVATLV